MKKRIVYKRLINDNGHFVGFQRTIIEYLPAGSDRWQFESFDYNDELSTRISQPPYNIISMQRPMKVI